MEIVLTQINSVDTMRDMGSNTAPTTEDTVMKIYGCYISGQYAHFAATEAEAQDWASTNGVEHQGQWLQGQYEVLEVTSATGHALLTEQPFIAYAEALAYVV